MTRRGLTGIAFALTVALTGCSEGVTGTPVADPSAAVKLDTGNFPTTPRDAPGREGDDAAVQGNIALSDYLVVPPDLDEKFDWSTSTKFPSFAEYASMRNMFGMSLTWALSYGNASGVRGAFSEEPRIDGTETPKMVTIVLRYFTEKDAIDRYSELRKLQAKDPGKPIGKYPDAYEGPAPEALGGTPTFWLRYKEFILAASFGGIADRARIEALTTSFFDRQLPRLDQVPFSPASGRLQPIDRDGIMRRTMYVAGDASKVRYIGGYFSPRAWGITTNGRWKAAQSRYRLYGFELVGSEGRNQVFRLVSASRADDFVKSRSTDFVAENNATGGRLEQPIPGLPQSVCVSRFADISGQTERIYLCQVAFGRYVATAQGSGLAAAQQATAASYMVQKNSE